MLLPSWWLRIASQLAPPIYLKEKEDWEDFHYNPDHKGIEFCPTSDGTYEQVFVRDLSSGYMVDPLKKERILHERPLH